MIARLSMSHVMAALFALFLIGLARPAAAQAPAPQPSPGALLVAKQIVEIKGVKNVFVPLVRGVVQKTKDMFMQTNFMWQKDLDEVAAIEDKKYAPRVDELVDATARMYAQHFTEPELKQLLAFYQSPVGKRRWWRSRKCSTKRWPMPAPGETICPRKSSATCAIR